MTGWFASYLWYHTNRYSICKSVSELFAPEGKCIAFPLVSGWLIGNACLFPMHVYLECLCMSTWNACLFAIQTDIMFIAYPLISLPSKSPEVLILNRQE